MRLCPLVLCLAAFAAAQTPTRKPAALGELSAAIEEVARTATPAVVFISVRSRAPIEDGETRHTGFLANQQSSGSGVIVDANGYIITNAHVVEGAQKIEISVRQPATPDGDDHRHFPAKVLGVDRETDLALLKIEATGLPTLSFCDSSQLRQGQLVVAIGSPLGLDNSLTVGYVSAPMRHLRPDQPMFYVQTDAAINPGNSGGPLLDTAGRIAGINTLILSQSGGSEGIGFAIPSNLVQRVYQELRANGRMHRGVIGVVPQEITPTLGAALGLEHHSGVILSDIMEHGAAQAAGLEPGDIVVAADGKPVKALRQLKAAIFQHSAGEEMTLDVLRGQEKLTRKVAVVEPPNAAGNIAELARRNPRLVRQLGILALPLDENVTDVLTNLRRLSGVVVAAIPAEFAGLNPGIVAGDVIYALNGKRVASVEELENALAAKKSGDPIALQVEREGHLIYVAFELD